MEFINKKLGLKTNMNVLIINPPDSFGTLVNFEGVILKKRLTKKRLDYIHLFVFNKKELENNFSKLKAHLNKSGLLWISWPKGASSIKTDLKRDWIREYGLANGLVDVKVASINNDWSALKFVYRLKDR